jgi:hypothetical protein
VRAVDRRNPLGACLAGSRLLKKKQTHCPEDKAERLARAGACDDEERASVVRNDCPLRVVHRRIFSEEGWGNGHVEPSFRALLASSSAHVEAVCEKITIYHMVLDATRKYQINTSSGRGFNSIDPWHDLSERSANSGKERLVVIVLSDFDSEGEMIPQVGGRTLRDDFGVEDLAVIKAGVTREQIDRDDLPPMAFAKEASSNRKWFTERNNGDSTVWELEALNPEDMLNDLDKAIRSVLDIDLFEQEIAEQDREEVWLESKSQELKRRLRTRLR